MRTRLTGCGPDSQDDKNLAPWQQKRAENKAKNTARKQRKSKQDTELSAKRKEMEKQKVRFNSYLKSRLLTLFISIACGLVKALLILAGPDRLVSTFHGREGLLSPLSNFEMHFNTSPLASCRSRVRCVVRCSTAKAEGS
jgi:hypothetical protein